MYLHVFHLQESLQVKSGPVKHSPPEKIDPEPNPWSPVCNMHMQTFILHIAMMPACNDIWESCITHNVNEYDTLICVAVMFAGAEEWTTTGSL
jgi:hypothetical protein